MKDQRVWADYINDQLFPLVGPLSDEWRPADQKWQDPLPRARDST
jgi:hypothetical protein